MAIEQNSAGVGVNNEKVVDTLNGFLRGELSAVETYRQAMEKITDGSLRSVLEQNGRSHEERSAKLRNRIAQLAGKPSEGSGAWGGFARLVEGGAKAFGVKAALSALEEGEDHGLRMYKDDLDKLDTSTRSFVEGELLPAQQRSHDAMSALKHSVH
jgi:rubrerythrin